MKKIIHLSYFTFILLAFLTSCEKNETNATDAISKIETNYEGTGEKDESKNIDNTPTTIASEELINFYFSKLRDNNDLTRNKNELKSYVDKVGVIKGGSSCGSYPEFQVWMDGNDGSNNHAWYSGWTGTWYISGGNSYMAFCLVPASKFGYVSGTNYAVLKVTANNASSFLIRRFFDCEDKKNASNCKDGNNAAVKEFSFEPNDKETTTSMTDRGNFNMCLTYYPDGNASNYTTFPNLGISYGVFGKIYGKTLGHYVTWEEQTGCINQLYYYENGSVTKNPLITVNGSKCPGIENLIWGYCGTDMLISKIY